MVVGVGCQDSGPNTLRRIETKDAGGDRLELLERHKVIPRRLG